MSEVTADQAAEAADEAGAPPVEPASLTNYVVLAQDAERGGWTESGKVEARGAGEAVRRHAERYGEGTYIAVPLRSWKPVKVAAETQTRLTYS